LRLSILFTCSFIVCRNVNGQGNNIPHRPNIIFILTDDQRWDALGVMENSILKTPNLDKIANQGILFKNA
jgi:arylsulfatase A-like enzyme